MVHQFEPRRAPETRSVGELLSDLARDLTTLVRKEIQLVRSEMSDKLGRIQLGAGSIVAGAIMLLAALLVLLQALVIALTNAGLGAGWSSLIVGVVVAGIGAVLLKKGADQMKPDNLMPNRTKQQLKQDAELMKEQVR